MKIKVFYILLLSFLYLNLSAQEGEKSKAKPPNLIQNYQRLLEEFSIQYGFSLQDMNLHLQAVPYGIAFANYDPKTQRRSIFINANLIERGIKEDGIKEGYQDFYRAVPLAHELAHHIMGHTFVKKRVYDEVKADVVCGNLIYKLFQSKKGEKLEIVEVESVIKKAMTRFALQESSAFYPSRDDRESIVRNSINKVMYRDSLVNKDQTTKAETQLKTFQEKLKKKGTNESKLNETAKRIDSYTDSLNIFIEQISADDSPCKLSANVNKNPFLDDLIKKITQENGDAKDFFCDDNVPAENEYESDLSVTKVDNPSDVSVDLDKVNDSKGVKDSTDIVSPKKKDQRDNAEKLCKDLECIHGKKKDIKEVIKMFENDYKDGKLSRDNSIDHYCSSLNNQLKDLTGEGFKTFDSLRKYVESWYDLSLEFDSLVTLRQRYDSLLIKSLPFYGKNYLVDPKKPVVSYFVQIFEESSKINKDSLYFNQEQTFLFYISIFSNGGLKIVEVKNPIGVIERFRLRDIEVFTTYEKYFTHYFDYYGDRYYLDRNCILWTYSPFTSLNGLTVLATPTSKPD